VSSKLVEGALTIKNISTSDYITHKDAWIIGGAKLINSHWWAIDEVHLSKIFTEYEFIGNCCHKYSEDYVFIPTDECIMLTQKKLDTDNYFIVFWSHGGISTENKKFMEDLLT
jgi:dihydrofolate reductase